MKLKGKDRTVTGYGGSEAAQNRRFKAFHVDLDEVQSAQSQIINHNIARVNLDRLDPTPLYGLLISHETTVAQIAVEVFSECQDLVTLPQSHLMGCHMNEIVRFDIPR
nr:hypothetical protein [Pseudorhizobium banfieldiae]